ncbi:MAG TPA: SurA N-terminal domain-containing protein [Pyrinomonadaceae bacterium]|nr:SurA N-terminal domain-containing protein [Pyrinomonadaceae bacterium]
MHRVGKESIVFGLAIVLTGLLIAGCDGSKGGANASGGKDTAVAATVNGKNIMLSEVDTILNQQVAGQQSQLSPLQLAAARLQVLDGLVQQQVLYQRAEKEKLLPSEDEITQEINAQKQQKRMTEEEYARMLQESKQTEQSLREIARRDIAVRKLQEKIIGRISISDKEVEEFYNGNKQQFVNARGIGLADIVVDPKDNGAADDAKSDVEAKSKIDVIYQRLKSGADFADVARQRSEDPSNIRGGDIGFATEEQLKQTGFPPDLIGRFFTGMQVGDYTAPVRFPNGAWYIFKLTGRQLQNENLTIDSPGVKDQIKDGLIKQRQQLLNAALLSVAMNEAKIENNLAVNMLNSPSNLSGLRPAAVNANAAAPAATTSTTPAVVPSPTAANR